MWEWKWNELFETLPFLQMLTRKIEMPPTLTTRLMETVVMALVVAVMGYVLIIPRLEEKLVNLQHTITEVKQDIKQIQRDLYVPKSGNSIHQQEAK